MKVLMINSVCGVGTNWFGGYYEKNLLRELL